MMIYYSIDVECSQVGIMNPASVSDNHKCLQIRAATQIANTLPDSKFHGANMGPTWVLSAPGGPHVGLMNLAIWIEFWYRCMVNAKAMVLTNWDSCISSDGMKIP